MRYEILLSYDGSPFCGWQVQNQVPTVQESLQKALSTLLGGEIAVTGAGRTDTGVHATYYVAHFDTAGKIPYSASDFGYKLNAILPRGIVIHDVSEIRPDFHARFDAREREYRYFLHRRKDPFVEAWSYRYTFPLDVDRMNEAALALLGTHDFHCFEKTGGDNKTSVCTVREARWQAYTPGHVQTAGYPAHEGDYLYFTIRADRFLRNMVRAIVGTLLEIGRGRQDVSWTETLLQGGTRSDAGTSVPARGLFLCGIRYPETDGFPQDSCGETS